MSGIVKHLELEATSGVELGWAYDSSDHEYIPTFVQQEFFFSIVHPFLRS